MPIPQYTDLPQSYNRKHLWSGNFSVDNLIDWARIGTFSIDMNATTHTATGNAYQRGYWALDIAYKHYFMHKTLSLWVGIDDVFDTQHLKVTNISPTLRYNFYAERQYRKVWCSLTYNISSKGKVEKKRMQNNNNIKYRM